MVTVAGKGEPSAGSGSPSAGQASAGQTNPGQPSPDPILNQRPAAQNPLPRAEVASQEGRGGINPLFFVLAAVALLACGAAGYLLAQRSGDDGSGSDAAASDGVEVAQESELGSSAAPSLAEEVTSVARGIGYDGVEATERDGVIYLSGAVENQNDIAAIVDASSSVADGMSINTDGLTVGSVDGADSETGDPSTGDTEETEEPVASVPAMPADPLQRLQVSLHRTVAATPIIFAPGVSDIDSWHTETLDDVAELLLANPGIAVVAIGYTDESGSAESNRALSLERADSVRAFLVGKGVAPGLIQTDARGESEASGLRDIGYLERRVEFEVVAASTTPPAVLPLNVGIIVPSPRDDLAFSQSLVDALSVLGEERGGLSVTITDNMFDPEEGRQQARQYVADGHNVVILHGAEFLPIVEDLALEFPDVVFVSGPDGYETSLPNVFVYVVFAEQGAYVMGDIAASLSDSGTIGIVGPIKVPEPQRYVDGFKAGAEAQGAEVLVDYVGSFFDVEAATVLAEGFADAGADVLTGTAELVVGPIDVADKRDLTWFANQTNPSELAPDKIVAAQVYHFEVALREIMAEIDANSTSGGTFPLTLGNGGMLLEFNPEFELDRALRSRADELLFDIAAGSLVVEVDIEPEG